MVDQTVETIKKDFSTIIQIIWWCQTLAMFKNHKKQVFTRLLRLYTYPHPYNNTNTKTIFKYFDMASTLSLPVSEKENEFKISSNTIGKCLSIVMKAVSTKTSSVILESILISASGQLELF